MVIRITFRSIIKLLFWSAYFSLSVYSIVVCGDFFCDFVHGDTSMFFHIFYSAQFVFHLIFFFIFLIPWLDSSWKKDKVFFEKKIGGFRFDEKHKHWDDFQDFLKERDELVVSNDLKEENLFDVNT